MLFETLFLAGVYLVPLALISALSAWADNRRPKMALFLCAISAGLIAYVGYTRPQGLFGLADIPELSVRLLARMMGML